MSKTYVPYDPDQQLWPAALRSGCLTIIWPMTATSWLRWKRPAMEDMEKPGESHHARIRPGNMTHTPGYGTLPYHADAERGGCTTS